MGKLAKTSSVMLRLQRWGAKHKPVFRLVVCERVAPRDGKHIEKLGTYHTVPDQSGTKHMTIDAERVLHWIAHGAQPSYAAVRLLGRAGILPPAPRGYWELPWGRGGAGGAESES